MALDGTVMASLTAEIGNRLEGGKIAKIAQPEKDELLFTVKNQKNTWRLLISASASLPLLYFTEQNKQSPMTAPNFCMLLRKHIGNGRIMRVSQPGLERIICMEIEHLDELGDKRIKKLYIEIMGKHSNIIFCNDEDMILDSIKHISAQVSSVREVLPGRPYFIPQTVEKKDPLTISEAEFTELIGHTAAPVQKALYMKLTGISPIVGTELCHLASIDGDVSANELTEAELIHLYHMFSLMMDDVKSRSFTPNIIYYQNEPVEFSALPLTCFEGEKYQAVTYDSISTLLEEYYASRNILTRIRQKSVDLRKIVQTALERNYKKYDLQMKQLKDTEKRDKYKVYGELLNTYGYELEGGEKKLTCLNYYTNEEITIPLDDQLGVDLAKAEQGHPAAVLGDLDGGGAARKADGLRLLIANIIGTGFFQEAAIGHQFDLVCLLRREGLRVLELLRDAPDQDAVIFVVCSAHSFVFLHFNICQWRSAPPRRPCTRPGTGRLSARTRPARH